MERTRNPWLALLVLCLGLCVILLDTTIVNVAIPTMIDSLHAGVDQILWVVNGFLLVFAVLLVTGGRLGDILGPRNLFAVGLVIFGVASALCGLALDANQLIAARVLQGVGAAVLMPQTTALISGIFPAERRGAAFGIMSAVAGIAGTSGPIVGGLIVTYLNWRWIFFVNVPIVVIAIVLAFLLVPDLRPGKRHRLDFVGTVLVTGGLFGVVFGLVEGQRYQWGAVAGTWLTIGDIMLAGALLLAVFVLWERSQPEPLLPLSLFRNRNFSITVWLMALFNIGLFGVIIATTIDLQSVLGMSAVIAGLTLAPTALVAAFAAPVAGRFTDRFGGRTILLLGFALSATGVAFAAVFESPTSTSFTFIIPLSLLGAGLGCVIAPITTEAMRAVPPVMAGAASGILNSSRQLGSAIGAALIGAVLQNTLASSLHDWAAADATQLPPNLRARFIDGFSHAARSGLQVGPSQGAGVGRLAGISQADAALVHRLVHDVFVNAFVTAMRPTLGVAVIVLVVGMLSCTLILPRTRVIQSPVPAERALAQVGAARGAEA